jgi:hypothetical protein
MRERAKFSASHNDTLALLEAELGRIGAKNAQVEIAIPLEMWRIDGRPRAHAQADHPGVVVRFESKYGPLAYSTDRFTRYQDNMRAIALGLSDLRRLERYGIANRGEQYRGWKELESGGPSPERGRQIIREHGDVRKALFATHPDHGGDAHDFADVQAAR